MPAGAGIKKRGDNMAEAFKCDVCGAYEDGVPNDGVGKSVDVNLRPWGNKPETKKFYLTFRSFSNFAYSPALCSKCKRHLAEEAIGIVG